MHLRHVVSALYRTECNNYSILSYCINYIISTQCTIIPPYSSKYKTFTHCCVGVESLSVMLAQHQPNIELIWRVCWMLLIYCSWIVDVPSNMRCSPNVGLLLGQRRRRWPKHKNDSGRTYLVAWELSLT